MDLEKPEPQDLEQILKHTLLPLVKAADPEPISMLLVAVQSFVFATNTFNKKLEGSDAKKEFKSRRKSREILQAFWDAIREGENAALNLQNAVLKSLSQLTILRASLSTIKKQQSINIDRNWLENSDVEQALNDIEGINPSELQLGSLSQLLSGLQNVIAAYTKVEELCEKQSKPISGITKLVVMLCKVFLIALRFLSSVLPLILVRFPFRVGNASASTHLTELCADAVLREFRDALESKISDYNENNSTELKEVTKRAEKVARHVRVEMKKIDAKVSGLHAELCHTADQTGRRAVLLSGLLDGQLLEDVVKQHGSLTQIRNSCNDLISSIVQGYDVYEKLSTTILDT